MKNFLKNNIIFILPLIIIIYYIFINKNIDTDFYLPLYISIILILLSALTIVWIGDFSFIFWNIISIIYLISSIIAGMTNLNEVSVVLICLYILLNIINLTISLIRVYNSIKNQSIDKKQINEIKKRANLCKIVLLVWVTILVLVSIFNYFIAIYFGSILSIPIFLFALPNILAGLYYYNIKERIVDIVLLLILIILILFIIIGMSSFQLSMM